MGRYHRHTVKKLLHKYAGVFYIYSAGPGRTPGPELMFALVYIIFSSKTCYVNHFLAFPEFRSAHRSAEERGASDLQQDEVPGTFFLKSRTEKRRFIFPETQPL